MSDTLVKPCDHHCNYHWLEDDGTQVHVTVYRGETDQIDTMVTQLRWHEPDARRRILNYLVDFFQEDADE